MVTVQDQKQIFFILPRIARYSIYIFARFALLSLMMIMAN